MLKTLAGHTNQFTWMGEEYYATTTTRGCEGCDFKKHCKNIRAGGKFVGCTRGLRGDDREVIWKRSSDITPKYGDMIEAYIYYLEKGVEPNFSKDEVIEALKSLVALSRTKVF